jgi:two-component system sensor histidine kinase AtoS
MVNFFINQATNPNLLDSTEISILLDGIGKAALLADRDQILAVNARATELTAYTRSELVKKPLDKVIASSDEIEVNLFKPTTDETDPIVNVITRNNEKIPSYVDTIIINEQLRLFSLEPVEIVKNRNRQIKERHLFLDTIHELNQILHIDNLDKAILKTLEIGSKLLDFNVLAIYVGNGQKPSANKVAYQGNAQVFPSEIFSSDLNQLLEPTIWNRGQRSITTFLHQGARAAGFSYLATYPIGDVGALVGILVAGGYQEPPPENCLSSLKILSGYLTNIINKSTLIANLRRNVQENIQNISILESAKNVISDGIAIVTTNMQIEEINQSAEVILGYANREVQGLEVNEVFIGTDRLVPAVQLALQGVTTPNLGDVNLHRRDGTEFPAEISTVPIQHKDVTLGVFIILRDKSEKEQIRIRTHQLEQRALLGEVTAIFAHEVRNPINNISTGLQLMAEDSGENDPNHELINRMLHDCRRLTNLMESVLTFSRSGNYIFIPIFIGDLLKRLIKLWTPRMNRLNIEHHINISPQKLRVKGDRRALEQVFTNLISNAIQAMQELGGGTLAIKVTQDSNGNGRSMIQVDVSDTGPGIPEENRNRIFEPFFTTKKNGTGLGLAITKQIITAHKGIINLTTFPGGTVFHVFLPAITETERY